MAEESLIEPDTIDTGHKPTMELEARPLRDAWLRAFSEKAIVGRLYGENGTQISIGMSPTAWLSKLKILDPRTKNYVLSIDELRGLWLKLAMNYNTAASFHANYTLAAKTLERSIDEAETDFIMKEMAKYRQGGEYWDTLTKKLVTPKPTKEAFQVMARAHTITSRREFGWYQLQAEFFNNIMMSLETQRRCLKDYGELLSMESKPRGGMNF